MRQQPSYNVDIDTGKGDDLCRKRKCLNWTAPWGAKRRESIWGKTVLASPLVFLKPNTSTWNLVPFFDKCKQKEKVDKRFFSSVYCSIRDITVYWWRCYSSQCYSLKTNSKSWGWASRHFLVSGTALLAESMSGPLPPPSKYTIYKKNLRKQSKTCSLLLSTSSVCSKLILWTNESKMRGKAPWIESISSLHITLHPNLTENHNLWVVKTNREHRRGATTPTSDCL